MKGRHAVVQKLSARKLGRRYFFVGLAGLLALFAGALIPAAQRSISRAETGIFFQLNRILGINPVWDGSFMVTASDLWVYVAYGVSVLIFLGCAWRIRRVDYGQALGFIALTALVTLLVENLADLVADNLHRMLPWRDGVIAAIRREHGYHFFDINKAEGIVDDGATALFCLFLMMRVRFPRAAWAVVGLLAPYVLSNLVVGTQWLTVQLSSMLLGMAMAGLALNHTDGLARYLERKASQGFVGLLGGLLLSRKLIDRPLQKGEQAFWRRIAEQSRRMNPFKRNRFWHDVVKSQAIRLLGADPEGCELYKSPNMTQERVKSSGKVRFLKTETGELYVLRATRHLGGLARKSPNFVRFADSVKNNAYLQRLGFPAPRIYWVQEGLTAWGMKNYLFAIEEYVESRPLDQGSEAELGRAMRLLATLHRRTGQGWGRIYDEPQRSRAQYVLKYLRDDVTTHLKRIDDILRLHLESEDLSRLWAPFEAAAVEALGDESVPFRLIHGDVSPRNFRMGRDGELVMIDFPTMRHDLAGWEAIKASISLTRERPEHCAAAWQAYFAEAGPERWREFQAESRLAFARFALRELAHRRVRIGGETDPKKRPSRRKTLEWIEGLFAPETAPWGETPAETDWGRIFAILGIHQEWAAEQAAGDAGESMARAGAARE